MLEGGEGHELNGKIDKLDFPPGNVVFFAEIITDWVGWATGFVGTWATVSSGLGSSSSPSDTNFSRSTDSSISIVALVSDDYFHAQGMVIWTGHRDALGKVLEKKAFRNY